MIPNQNWYAPSLTSNREAGLGNWSIKDIIDLAAGRRSHRGTVYGPMAEVVYNSLQYMSDDDVKADGGVPEGAAATRLRAAAHQPGPARRPDGDGGGPQGLRDAVRDVPRQRGQGLSAGRIRRSPATSRSRWRRPSTRSGWCSTAATRRAPRKNPRPHGMPPFSHILNDDEVAAVVTYIRVAWENSGTPVAAAQANDLRKLLPE